MLINTVELDLLTPRYNSSLIKVEAHMIINGGGNLKGGCFLGRSVVVEAFRKH